MGKSSIEWTDETWNPVRGCTKVSPGCKHCYAETFAERFRGVPGHPYELGFDPRLAPDKLDEPLHWKKPRRVFVNSMSDLFHKDFPNEYIAAVFGVMAACPQHTFQVLTKRADRLPEWFAWLKERSRGHMHGAIGAVHEAMESVDKGLSEGAWTRMVEARRAEHGEPTSIGDATAWSWPLQNVWIGVSVEDQERADERIPHLLRTPAAVRFLSCEPLLGPLYLPEALGLEALGPPGTLAPAHPPGVDWVIIGGESGGGARPLHIDLVRGLVDQCRTAKVATFVKQWGARLQVDYYDDARDDFEERGHDWTPVGWSEGDGQPQPDALVELRLPKKGGDLAAVPGDWPRQFPEVRRAG